MLTRAEFELKDRVAIVTGSGRNIGRAIAEAYATMGARVVVNGHRDREAIEAVASGIRSRGGDAIAVLADVSDDDSVQNLVKQTIDAYGGVDVVVSNVASLPYRPFLEIYRRRMGAGTSNQSLRQLLPRTPCAAAYADQRKGPRRRDPSIPSGIGRNTVIRHPMKCGPRFRCIAMEPPMRSLPRACFLPVTPVHS